MAERFLAKQRKIGKPKDFLEGRKTAIGERVVLDVELEHLAEERSQLAIHLYVFPEVGRGKILLEEFALQWRSFGLGSARPQEDCSIDHETLSEADCLECRRNVLHAKSVPGIILQTETCGCWCAPQT
jgi:hypothetical protein